MLHLYNPIWEVEARESELQGHTQLHSFRLAWTIQNPREVGGGGYTVNSKDLDDQKQKQKSKKQFTKHCALTTY